MKVIPLLGDRLLLVLSPLLGDLGQTVLQPRTAVADEVIQGGQGLQLLGPLLAVPSWRKAAAQPAVTLGLNHHQHRLLSEEGLIRTGLDDPRASVFGEDLQHGPGAAGGQRAQASWSSDGGDILGQDSGEEAARDRQANAFGLGTSNELGQQVGGANDGLAQVDLEPLPMGLQVGDLLLQTGQPVLAGSRVEVCKNGVGFVGEPLAADAALLGLGGKVTTCSEEDDGGPGETRRRGDDARGVSFCYAGGDASALLL